MKLAGKNNSHPGHRKDALAVIPLVPITDEETKEDVKTLQFKVWSDPTDTENSMGHKVTLSCYSTNGSNSPERFCKFKESLDDLIKGQGNGDNPSAINQLILQLLVDDALQAYKTATELALEGNTRKKISKPIIEEGLASVTDLVFPKGARQLQARYLRRSISKPRKMTAGGFVSRVQTINRYFKYFPGMARIMPDDELVEILLAATPNKWQTELHRQGFQFETCTVVELKERLERMETCEHLSGESTSSSSQNRQGQGGRQDNSSGSFNGNAARTQRGRRGNKRRNNGNDNDEKVPCMLHGTTDHTTEECKVLKAQAKRMRGAWDTNRTTGRPRRNRNNTYNRNGHSNRDSNSTEEIHVIRNDIGKLSKKLERLEVEKPKSKKRVVDSDSDSDSD